MVPLGRKLQRTEFGRTFALQAAPLLAELSEIVHLSTDNIPTVTLIVARGILVGWGPRFLREVARELPSIKIELSEASGPESLMRVASGEVSIGLIRGRGESAPQLEVRVLGNETMALVPSALKRLSLKPGAPLVVMSLPLQTDAMKIVKRRLKKLERDLNLRVEISQSFESSPALVQLALAGFGHALVPLAVAKAAGVKPHQLMQIPAPGIQVPISIVARKRSLERPEILGLLLAMKKLFPQGV